MDTFDWYLKLPSIKGGLEGLAEVVGRWEVGGEWEMVIKEREGGGQEGGLAQEGVEGLRAEETKEEGVVEMQNTGDGLSQSTTTRVFPQECQKI